MNNNSTTSEQTSDTMPGLPQILIRLLEAFGNGQSDLGELASIVRLDPAISARVLQLANSSRFRRPGHCRTIETALATLGLDTVRTLVLTTAVRQYFQQSARGHHTFLQSFWQRSLRMAHSARVLATLTRHPMPEEAYLAGLLTDIGQLYLLNRHPDTWPDLWRQADSDEALLHGEQRSLGTDHCITGAELIEQWRLDGFVADAVRYHQETPAVIRSGHHLVKLANAASTMGNPSASRQQRCARATALFDLHEDLAGELCQRIDTEVQKTVEQLDGAPANSSGELAWQRLGTAIKETSQRQALQSLLRDPGSDDTTPADRIHHVVHLVMAARNPVLFLQRKDRRQLQGFTEPGATTADFLVDREAGDSVVSASLRNDRPVIMTGGQPPTGLLDRQLRRHCGSDHLLCIPFSRDGQAGILVAGASADTARLLRDRGPLWRTLAGDMLPLLQAVETPPDTADGDAARHQRDQVRHALHEVSNPISIISNYLELLRARLGEDHEAGGDIDVIREEMERIGSILLRLRDPDVQGTVQRTDINRALGGQARLLERSLCQAKGVHLRTSLDETIPEVSLDPVALKQIISNLAKNAIEALSGGGTLTLRSRGGLWLNNRPHVAVDIIDDGPGLPAAVLENLSGGHSSKGEGREGAGLRIVSALVDELAGQLQVDSHSDGTAITVLLPLVVHSNDRVDITTEGKDA